MTKDQYLKELRHEIRFAPKDLYNEITSDVEATIIERSLGDDQLISQLGTPQQLAHQYLMDAEIPISAFKRALYFSRNMFAILGIIIFILLAGLYAIYSYYADFRVFEYSNQDLAAQHPDFTHEITWLADTVPSINVQQTSSLVLYSHPQEVILLRCLDTIETATSINQNACLLFVPQASSIELTAKQSYIHLIRPQANINLSTEQSTISVLDTGTPYNTTLQYRQSTITALGNDTSNPYKLKLKLFQSTLKPYIPE